jgi:hypothetical protein
LSPAATPEEYLTKPTASSIEYFFGVWVQFSDVTPGADIDFLQCEDSTPNIYARLRLKTDGTLALIDRNNSEVNTVSPDFIVDTYHFVEMGITRGTGANGIAHVDIDKTAKFTETGQDFNAGSGISRIRLRGADNTPGNPIIYFDSFYAVTTSGADNPTRDQFYGDFAVKGFQSTDVGDTDQGDALADGTWALVSETPGNEGTSNDAQYQDTGNLTGSTITDGGDRPGPSGDSDVTGATIKGAKYISNLKRGAGGGRVHTILHGNNVDGVTATADLGLTTDYIIYEVLSELASIVPTESESFQQGFSKSATAGQDILCGDQWAMLGYVPAAEEAAPIPSLVMAPYIPA